jgi:hypothetical protein
MTKERQLLGHGGGNLKIKRNSRSSEWFLGRGAVWSPEADYESSSLFILSDLLVQNWSPSQSVRVYANFQGLLARRCITICTVNTNISLTMEEHVRGTAVNNFRTLVGNAGGFSRSLWIGAEESAYCDEDLFELVRKLEFRHLDRNLPYKSICSP